MYPDNNKENYYPALRGLQFYVSKLRASLSDEEIGNDPVLGKDIQLNIELTEKLINDINVEPNIYVTIINNCTIFCQALKNYEEYLVRKEQELPQKFSGITPEIPNLKQEIKTIRDNLTTFCI